jgi:hypothetical protein
MKNAKKVATATEAKIEKTKRIPEERLYHARVSLYGLPNMDKRGVQRTAKWLRSVADNIEKEPKAYNTRFIAKLMKTSK